MPSASRSATFRLLLRRDSKFLFLFAFYGLVAGIVTYLGTVSYDENDVFSSLSNVMNFPSFLVFFFFEYSVAYPNDFSILNGDIGLATLMIGSIGVWAGIGLVVYGFVKMLKLGP